ncbi:MAG: 23S rRNA (uracil(1939)-C(5))-methyltransferase RlmD [Acholeplasmatales bacterium]|nr:23S rRNA (uracil(1939)-C(5))-methyltransferase RlmD [Acholeplasmatales bacterium]
MKNNNKVGDEFILDIKRLGINGEGIGFYNKKAVFVDNAIPGEGVNVKVSEVTEKLIKANMIEIKNKSENRVAPICPKYGICGGCNTMHIKYDYMLKLKKEIVVEAITRYTKLNPKSFEIKDTIPSNNYNYRNRSQLGLRFDDGKASLCMTKANSNIMISIDDCYVQNEIINRINHNICKLIEDNNISVFSYKNNKGVLRYVTIRVNKKGDALVDLVIYDDDKNIDILASKINKLDNVIGVYKSVNRSLKSGSEIVGEELTHLCGKEYIIEEIGKIKYMIYPDTFFQLNTLQAEKMAEIVLKNCKLSFKERVLDAYSGIGFLGLYLAHNSKEVVGIEYNANSVKLANMNANMNKINNAKFYQGDSSELLKKMIDDGDTFDVIVVDQPRTGLDQKFMDALIKANAKRIVYVSCNPATLAKNLSFLSNYYNVNSITPMDFFPNTALVESVAVLNRK